MAPVMLDEQRGSGYCPFGHVNARCLFRMGRAVWSLQPRGCSPVLRVWFDPNPGHLSLFVLVGGSIVMVVWLGLRASSSTLTCDILVCCGVTLG